MRPRGARNEGFFNARAGGTVASLDALYKSARHSGSLNLSQKGLDEVPPEVFSLEAHAAEGEKFWEFTPLTKLDLSHNTITSLPPEVANLADLTSLKMRNNRLTQLPPEMFDCVGIRHLDLSDNQLSDPLFGDDGICRPLPELTECYFTSNALTRLPHMLFYCSSIRHLNLNDNKLTSIPEQISTLQHLSHLSLQQNLLRTLPNSLGQLQGLVELDVRKNQLQSLPNLSATASLQVLDAGENKISQLPEFNGNTSLHRLHIDFNQLSSLPDALFVACQHSLFELHVHDNHISELSTAVGLLNELKVLDISNNSLNDLPPTLGYISTLQRLLVDGNPIRTIRRYLLTQSTVNLKKYLCTRGPPLQLSSDSKASRMSKNTDEYNEYGWSKEEKTDGDIPLPMLQRLRNIDGTLLDLSELKIDTLPNDWTRELFRSRSFDSMDTSINVTSIDFTGNCLQGIPKELFSSVFSSCLKEINLTSNELGGRIHFDHNDSNPLIPPFVKQLNLAKNKLSTHEVDAMLTGKEGVYPRFSLHNLLLPYNALIGMPLKLSSHVELRELQLSYNKLNTLLPLDFSWFPHLTILDLSNNQISELGNVHQARQLQTLLLENNNLTHIPPELCCLEKLQTLSLFGNPQKTVRQAIIHKGTEAILLSLRGKLGTTPSQSTSSSSLYDTPNCQQAIGSSTRSNISDSPNALSSNVADMQKHSISRQDNQVQDRAGGDLSKNSGSITAKSARGDNDEAIGKLQEQVRSLELELDSPSLSQAKRFALKKEAAKARANIIRLKRQAENSS